MILRDQAGLYTPIPDLKATLISHVLKDPIIKGIDKEFDYAELQFDSKWLLESSSVLSENWCTLHHHLSTSTAKLNKFDIMACLSTMAYATSANTDAVQALGAVYRLRDLATVHVPAFLEVRLSLGEAWDTVQLDRKSVV